MKQRFSILDIKAITNELNQRISNSFIQNFYSTQQRLLFIRFSNKDTLLIEPSARMHLVQSYDTEISHFCKKLRELCRHAKVHRIYQYGYDRIVIIDIQRYRIVIEFFSAGNVLILGENDVIVDLLRPIPDLKIAKGEKYQFNYIDLDFSFDKFKSLELSAFLPFEKEFVRYFAKSLEAKFGKPIETLKDEVFRKDVEAFLEQMKIAIESIGGFGEVVLAKQKPDLLFPFKATENATSENSLSIQPEMLKKDTAIVDTAINEQQNLEKSLTKEAKNGEISNRLAHLNCDQLIEEKNSINGTSDNNLLPHDYKNLIQLVNKDEISKKLSENNKAKILYFKSFNSAAEYFFGDLGKAKKQEKEGKEVRIKKAQEKYIDELENQANEHRETADILEENRVFVNSILNIFKRVLQSKMEWSAFETFWESEKNRGNLHALAIASFDLREKKCIIHIEDRYIEIDLSIGLDKNIENYFLKKKKAVDKQKKTKNALDNIVEKLNSKKEVYKPQKRESYWFEKFHFFISSEGILVIGGKNAQQNDILVKKHLESTDLYFHGEVQGASSVICKIKPEATYDATIEEAAYMSLCMSKCWTDGIIQPVFYVDPSQVSKTLPNGDLAPPGTFIISGKKTMVYPKRLEYGLGILFKSSNSKVEIDFITKPEDGDVILHAMPVCAPWCVVKNYKYKVRLCPGEDKKSKVVGDIQKSFWTQSERTPEEEYVKTIGTEEYNAVILSKCKMAKIIN